MTGFQAGKNSVWMSGADKPIRMDLDEADAAEWRPVPGYPGYEASTDGRVRGPRRVVKGTPDHGGYLRAGLAPHGVKRSLHSLVALAFHGERPANHHVDHINGNRRDNRPANLRYVSQVENEHNKKTLGTVCRGSRMNSSKLTEDDVHSIRERLAGGRGEIATLSREYGVTYCSIRSIALGLSWGWLPPKATQTPNPKNDFHPRPGGQ